MLRAVGRIYIGALSFLTTNAAERVKLSTHWRMHNVKGRISTVKLWNISFRRWLKRFRGLFWVKTASERNGCINMGKYSSYITAISTRETSDIAHLESWLIFPCGITSALPHDDLILDGSLCYKRPSNLFACRIRGDFQMGYTGCWRVIVPRRPGLYGPDSTSYRPPWFCCMGYGWLRRSNTNITV